MSSVFIRQAALFAYIWFSFSLLVPYFYRNCCFLHFIECGVFLGARAPVLNIYLSFFNSDV